MIQITAIDLLLSMPHGAGVKALKRLAAAYDNSLACDTFMANTIIAGWTTGN
jgi:methylglyoxal synthase